MPNGDLTAYCERAGLVRFGEASRMLGVDRVFLEDLVNRGHMVPVQIPWGDSGRIYLAFHRTEIETLQQRIRLVGVR
jgi:hypothetical protein